MTPMRTRLPNRPSGTRQVRNPAFRLALSRRRRKPKAARPGIRSRRCSNRPMQTGRAARTRRRCPARNPRQPPPRLLKTPFARLRKLKPSAQPPQIRPKTTPAQPATPPKGERGALTDQQIAQGITDGGFINPHVLGLEELITFPKQTSITAGLKYGPTFENPKAAAQYAQDGLAKHWFGDSDGAAIVKEGKGYSVYGTHLGLQFSPALPGDKADENFKAMKPHPGLTALVSGEGMVADYRGGQASVIYSPAAPVNGSADKPWTSRTLDVMEGMAGKTMPKGSQFSWARTWQVQAGSKVVQSLGQKWLAAMGFGLGSRAPGASKTVAAPVGAAAGWLLGKAVIPSDIEVRVDADGRKSNIMFLDTDVHGGTVRFGFVNNMTGGFGGKTAKDTAAIVTLDAALKSADYQGASGYALLLHALYNGLSTEMNVEVSFAQKDRSAPGQKGDAAGPLVPDDGTKVWLSFSFVAVSEGGQSSQDSRMAALEEQGLCCGASADRSRRKSTSAPWPN